MDNITLIMITLFFISSGLVIAVLNFMQSRKNKKFKRTLEKLEIEKNKLATSPIVPELAKVEAFLNNDKLKELYDEWTKRLNQIKEVQIPKLSDLILDAEYSLSQMRFKDYNDYEFSTDYEMFTKFEILKDAGGIHPEICKFFQEMDYDSAEKNIFEIMEHYGMDDKSTQSAINRLRDIQNLFN